MRNTRVSTAASPAAVHSVVSFLPDLAIEHAGGHGLCSSDELHAAVVFADIAGFTALTERLAAQGPEGAEELTRHLNQVFGQLTDLVAEMGGDTVKFAGDALLALWVAEQERDLARAVAAAASCALAIQQRMLDNETARALGLGMRLAVGAGRVAIATLGGVRERWELLVAGDALAQVGRVSQQAPLGAVLLSPEAARCLGPDRARMTEQAEGALLIELCEAPVIRPSIALPVGSDLLPALRSLIPRAIRTHLDAGLSDWIGELRELTILFIGLPELASLEPGTLARAQNAFANLQQAVYRYEGSINKLNGDDKGVSVLAVFGLPPLSHDDDPERGVRAACDVQRELTRLGLRSAIGVASGQAFCGAVGGERRREYTIMGNVVNLAARLMGAAGDGIYCDQATAQRAERLSFDALPPLKLKGKREPVALHRPRGTQALVRELPPRSAPGSTLVGRARELRRMDGWIERLLRGEAVRACVFGQAGSGKTALLARALASAQARGANALLTSAHAFERATPYHAWRALLCELLELSTAPADAQARIEHVCARLPRPELEAELSLLSPLVPLDVAASDNADEDPRERARRTRALVCQIVSHASAQRPVLIAIEDVQWLDAASRALLLEVAREVPAAALVLSARAEDAAHTEVLDALRTVSALDTLELRELGRRAVLQLVRDRLQVRALPRELAEPLCARAGGNPLFAETLAWALRDSGAVAVEHGRCRVRPSAGAETSELPRTLQAALTRRIDRLDPDVQLTLKLASVIGQEFELAALRAIHPLAPSPEDLENQCELLERLEWFTRGANGWSFRSGVAREVTYALMLFSQRRQLHRQLALWYESRPESVPLALLAHHWRCAADGKGGDGHLLERAADALARAAHEAVRSDASIDAIQLYRQALDCVQRMPAGEAALRRELALLLALGVPLVRSTSWAGADVGRNYQRAVELGGQVGDALQRFQALRGLWQFHTGQGEYARARALGDELLEVAGCANRAGLLLETHRMLGNTAFWSGDLLQAQSRLQVAIELSGRDAADPPLLSAYGQDPEVANRGILSWAFCFLARPADAKAEVERAVQRAEALEHPFTLAFALGARMWVHAFLGEPALSQEWAARTLELSRRRGFAYFETAASVVHGWACSGLGNVRAGLREIERALERWRAGGNTIGIHAFLIMLADAYRMAGRVDDARAALADPVFAGRASSEGWLEPLLRCVRAETLVAAELPEARAAALDARSFADERGARLIVQRVDRLLVP
jgi:class 3 adenylate cyclase/predicted ATPase